MECDQSELFGSICVSMTALIRLPTYDLHYLQLKKVTHCILREREEPVHRADLER